MTRVLVLRVGYAAFAVAFAALAASAFRGALLPLALGLGLVAALLLLFSDDDLPKWAGVVLVSYFGLIVVAFLLATPVTIRKGGSFGIEPPNPQLAQTVMYYLGALSPLMLAGTALAAAWEREQAARWLLLGAVGGLVVVGILTFTILPESSSAAAVQRAEAQGGHLRILLAVSAVSAALGAAWSAARPEEFA